MGKRLTFWIMIGLIAGLAVGWGLHAGIDDGTQASADRLTEIAGYFSILTTLFLRLIKMIIAPLVFSTLVVGIAHMGDTAALGRVGLKSIGWFVCASLLSLVLGLILVNVLQPGVGLALPLPPVTAATGVDRAAFDVAAFVAHIVPASMVDAMATNEILQIVVFSIFVGVAITAVGEKAAPLVKAVEAVVAVMLQITNYVMRFAPLAVFAAVASTLAERGPWRDRRPRLFHGILLSRPRHPVVVPDRHRLRAARPADAVPGPLHPRSPDPRLLDGLVRGGVSTHAGGARQVRGAAPDRELRAAARLFVQPGRIDDVHDLRLAVHRAGLRHASRAWRADHDAAGADGHQQGDRRGPRARRWW